MVEPFWDVLRRLSNSENSPPDSEEKTSHQKNSENLLLAALPVARKIVRSKLALSEGADDASDLEQGIALRLWKWRETHAEESERMSPDEWNALAARTAYNEVNRHFTGKINARSVPLEAASDVEAADALEGESKFEIETLARYIWQDICQMSLRQRRALLLHSRKLILYLLQGGIGDEELARVLEFAADVWLEIKDELPMSSIQIARLADAADKPRSLESVINSIKKARHEARARLRKLTRK